MREVACLLPALCLPRPPPPIVLLLSLAVPCLYVVYSVCRPLPDMKVPGRVGCSGGRRGITHPVVDHATGRGTRHERLQKRPNEAVR